MGKAWLFVLISIALLLLLGCTKAPPSQPLRPDSATIAAFSQDIEMRQATEGRITYKAVINGVDSKVDYYFKGEDFARIDYSADTRMARTYLIRGQSVACFADDGNWLCSATQFESPFSMAFLEDAKRQNLLFLRGNRTVMKHITTCYELRSPSSNDTHLSCMSQTGYPLYVQNNISGRITTMTAIRYSTTVDDNDFAIPAKVHYPASP